MSKLGDAGKDFVRVPKMPPLGLMVVAAAAFAVESAIGFGATVITVALAANFVPIDELLPAFVPVNMILSAFIALRDRRAIDARTLLVHVLPPMLVGLPIGILALAKLDERVLKIAFGVFVIVLSGVEIARMLRAPAASAPQGADRTPQRLASTVFDLALLVVGGAIHGAFGTGGPMAVYVAAKRLGEDRTKFRATLATLWLLLNTALVSTFAIRGAFRVGTLEASGILVPGLAVGTLIGTWAHPRIPQRAFRLGVFVLLTIAAGILIARAA